VGIAGYFALPSSAWQNGGYVVSNLVGLAAVIVGTRRGRPGTRSAWMLLAIFPAFTAAGNVVWLINDNILHIDPFPSWGDLFFLGGYLMLGAGLLQMVRARTPGHDRASVIDAGIVTTGFAVASWVFVMSPLMSQEDALAARVVALAYPAGNVLVLAVGVRLFVGSAARGTAYRLLGLNLLVQLTADTAFAILNLAGTYHTGHPVDALQLAYNLGWGVVALHPAMGELTRPQPAGDAAVGRPRLMVLTLASLVAPAVLVWQIVADHHEALLVTAGGAVVLFLLVVVRMTGLVRALEATLADRRALEAELQHRAAHDALTGLANRVLFADTVTRALAHHRDGAGACAVLFLDLDDFKGVNDRLGHAAGDELLQHVAHRLRGSVGDRGLIARLGGDEFAVLVDPLSSDDDGEVVAAELLDALVAPLRVRGEPLEVHASIGVAVSAGAASTDQLLAHADVAMYAAKATGKAAHRRYDPSMLATGPAMPSSAWSASAAEAEPPGSPAASSTPREALVS
jgi:diguanylate cyclase (GGDEF)-like protein